MRTTLRGRVLALLAFLFYFFANQTQVGWLYVLCALTLGLWLIARLAPRQILRNLSLTRAINGILQFSNLELHAGQPITVELELKNASRFPAWHIAGAEVCPFAPAAERAQPFFVSAIAPRGVATLRYETTCARRGWFAWPETRLTTGAPFGLFRATSHVPVSEGVLVFPEYRKINRWPLFDRLPAQENPYAHLGVGGEFIGVRDYRPGDSRRHVHWRSTARAGRLIVKEFAEETQPGLTIALDLRAASVFGAEPNTSLELAIKAAATLAHYADARGLPVHLAVNSRRWPAPPGPVSWWGVMNYLARAEPEGDDSFADVLRAPRRATFLAAICPAPEEAIVEPLIEARRAGGGVLAILVQAAAFDSVAPSAQPLAAALAGAGVDARVIGAEADWEKSLATNGTDWHG